MIIINKEYTIIAAEPTVTQLTGWEPADLIKKKLQELIPEDGFPFSQVPFGHGPTVQSAISFKSKDDVNVPFLCNISPLWPENAIISLQSMFPPAAEPYSFSIKYFFETNFMGIVLASLQNRILDANEAFLEMIGYVLEDFQSGRIGWRELVQPEYMPTVENALDQIQKYKAFTPFELQFIHKDGHPVDVLVGGGQGDTEDKIVAFVMDISQKKQAEREMMAGETLFRTMADSSTALIFFVKPDSRLRYLNKTAQEMFGVPPQAWENFDWSSYLHPDDVKKTYSLLEQAFQSKEGYINEFRIRRYDGVYRVIYSTGNPVIDGNGELLGYVGTGFDITELREAQQKLTSYAHKLEESNKELEHFAAIASHDLQEPLRKVLLFTDHLQKVDGASLSEAGTDDLKRIQSATGRMQRLINDLLDLSRITRRGSPFEKVDLHFLTREVITELSYFHPNAENRVTFEGGMTIHADYSQIHQMLTQLLDNALKFHKPDQPSSVTVRIQPANKHKCQITIIDDGLGMKPNQLPQIFDAFVRLHHGTEFSGTGIGLALVKKIVERHNGSIAVDSMPGQGSTFTVTLPVS